MVLSVNLNQLEASSEGAEVDKATLQSVEAAKKKAAEAKANLAESQKKIEALKAKKAKKEEDHPPTSDSHIQTQSTMDVKTNTGLVVSVEAVKKPGNASKVQELAAMEEALKKATEEAHKQRAALEGKGQSLTQEAANTQALEALKAKQAQQQQ